MSFYNSPYYINAKKSEARWEAERYADQKMAALNERIERLEAQLAEKKDKE